MTLPPNTPLNDQQKKLLSQLMQGITPQQSAWLSGFFTGAGFKGGAAPASSAGNKVPMTILYGSESGNAEKLAADVKKEAGKLGFNAKIVDMFDAKPSDLEKIENLIVVISTWGEGDPPERATQFWKDFEKSSLALPKTNFAVLALGDTSYVDFCGMGKKFDTKLEGSGAKRIYDRVDCDVAFEKPAAAWIKGALKKFAEVNKVVASAAPTEIEYDFAEAKTYSSSEPFTAKIKDKIMLNGTGSAKETWHVEINLEGSGLNYLAGDALGIVPQNDNALVDLVLKNANISDAKFAAELKTEFELQLTKPVVEKYLGLIGAKPPTDIQEYLYGRDLADLLVDYPGKIQAHQLRQILRPLPPRLYSIASAQSAVGEEVHLTIAAVRYNAQGRNKKGVTSGYIADDVPVDGDIKIYLKTNKNFRLPAADAPVIMVGPGTGVAPFRAFMQEREATGASGKNWLFFGDQHYNFDFLYQLEWQDWYKSKLLTNLDVAFSRDGLQKVYVQHKMWEKREELWKWLQDGAYFYVCGDEKRMAKDVDSMLGKIIAEVGGKNAEEFITDLKKQGRYLKDVY